MSGRTPFPVLAAAPVPRRPRRGAHRALLGLLVAVALASVGVVPPAVAPADAAAGRAGAARDVVYPLVFPLAVDANLIRDFGDPRGRDRSHAGTDIMAPKMTPVLAVADATVAWIHGERGGNCCDLALRHTDGWRSRYIHLNNDTPGTDDGKGYGIARGLRVGARVRAGQVIGYVGDSGNAEATSPHLHFELRRPDGTPVDPYPSLRAAVGAVVEGGVVPPKIAGPPVGPVRPGPDGPRAAPAPAPRRAAPGRVDGGVRPEAGAGEAPGDAAGAAGADGEPGADDPAAAPEIGPGGIPIAGDAPAEPVYGFVPTPGDSCTAGFAVAAMERAELAPPPRPRLLGCGSPVTSCGGRGEG